MSAALKVVRAGLFDTLQDLGRVGYMALGMPTAGAMDRIGLTLANALAGNPTNTAGIEIGVMGPDLLVDANSVRVALVGPLSAGIDRERGRCAQAVGIGPLARAEARSGAAGRHDRGSEHRLSRRVGRLRPSALYGQPLDLFPRRHRRLRGPQARRRRRRCRSRSSKRRPATIASSAVRSTTGAARSASCWGPQDDYFTEAGRQTFVTAEYKVSKEADRMGIRFEGPTIEHAKGADIISDGIGPGAIQVPGAGLPIVLLADRQTVGGYSKIATVASVDLPRLGRLLPGRTVRFTAVTVEEAEALRRDQETRLARAIASFQVARPAGGIDLARLYEENLIDGVVSPSDLWKNRDFAPQHSHEAAKPLQPAAAGLPARCSAGLLPRARL